MRAVGDTKRVLTYYRPSPDGKRLIFGGRARFTAAPPEVSAPALYQYMIDRFPQLDGIRITHVWTGNVAFALDYMPHMGTDQGMHYLLACNGNGVAMMTYLGTQTAKKIAGGRNAPINPLDGRDFPEHAALQRRSSWFLPMIGAWYRTRDWIDRRSWRRDGRLARHPEDVESAAARIGGAVVHTPCLRSETLSRIAKADVWIKFENLQFTASFKERGALNTLLQLTPEERKRGVIAMSAGNHAQGVAYHAGRLGIPATIVMPSFTPNTKVDAHARPRRAVVLHGDTLAEAGHRGASPGRTPRSLVFVHPYDDPRIIAGQGTIALEMLQDAPELDTLVVAGGRRRHDRGLRRGGARAEARHQGDRRRDRRATRPCASCSPASR